jgi:hypothetical protein
MKAWKPTSQSTALRCPEQLLSYPLCHRGSVLQPPSRPVAEMLSADLDYLVDPLEGRFLEGMAQGKRGGLVRCAGPSLDDRLR